DDDGVNVLPDLRTAAEACELDEHGDAGDLSAELSDEVDAGFHGAACGEDIVTDEDALPGADVVGVHFEGGCAVLEGVRHAHALAGELRSEERRVGEEGRAR